MEQELQTLLDDAAAVVARALAVESASVVEVVPGRQASVPRAGLGAASGVSGVTALIPGRDQAFGGLSAFSTSTHVFSRDDLAFMQSVANVLAAAVARAVFDDTFQHVRNAEREVTEALVLARTGETAEVLAPKLQRIGEELRSTISDISEAAQPIRVLLVEDHRSVREAIAATLIREPGLQVAGEAASLAEARAMLTDIDVALVDLSLPDGYGGDLIRQMRRVNPAAQALVLTATVDHDQLARAVDAGAAGVLNKTVELGEVVESVRRLHAGEPLVAPREMIDPLRLVDEQRDRDRSERDLAAQITARERDVLQGLAEGLDSPAIAERLHISVRTERNHVANILAKLGVHSRLQALVAAVRLGVVSIR